MWYMQEKGSEMGTLVVMGFSFVGIFLVTVVAPLTTGLLSYASEWFVFLFLYKYVFISEFFSPFPRKSLHSLSARAMSTEKCQHVDVIRLKIEPNRIFKAIRFSDKLNIVFLKQNTWLKNSICQNEKNQIEYTFIQ